MRTLGRRIDFGEAKMYEVNEVSETLFISYISPAAKYNPQSRLRRASSFAKGAFSACGRDERENQDRPGNRAVLANLKKVAWWRLRCLHGCRWSGCRRHR